jgi:hypothetical protein
MRLLRDTIEPLTTPIFGKKGMYYAQLLTKWAGIITEQGVLTVQVSNSAFSMQLIYQAPLIKEKIAQFFGFNLVDEIRVVAASHIGKQAAKLIPIQPLSPTKAAALEASLEGIDVELAAFLLRLGSAIANRG